VSAGADANLATLALRGEEDVVTARLSTRRMAERLGLDRQGQTRIATAVSEIARNAVTHGRGGELVFAVDGLEAPERFVVRVSDHGPGIAALDEVLAGRAPGGPGQGAGLVSARRLVDDFDIESSPGGTRVRLAQRIPRAAATRLDHRVLPALAAATLPLRSDALAAVREQNREIADSLAALQDRQAEAERLNRELAETNRGVVALYSELDERAEQLRSASELKSRFLSHMSHEFRTPLNSILALARLLLDRVDGDLTSEQQLQVEYVRRSAQTLLEMVNDLLDLAKVEAGKLDVKPGLFSVADLFVGLRGSLRPLRLNPAVELVFDEPTGVPEMFNDEAKVAQVLRNFISNALRFTQQGQVRVSVHYQRAGERVVFSVHDTGTGISAEDLRLIFDEFSQVAGPLQSGGTGLGLPLSRQLATLMGGEVAADSEPGRGSTFRLVLPVRLGQAHALPVDVRPGEGQARVLIIDDEEAFRYVVRHIAQDAGYMVSEAADGANGLRLTRQLRPDLVILDLQMPRADGFVVLAELSTADTADIPVIVCTARALSLEQKRSLSRAYAIMPKHELTRDGLTALMRGVLRRTEGGQPP
jgi:signal transduction histidine kinase/CheY-like chemotaxis protein